MNHDSETIWNCVFGPDATPAEVLQAAADDHVTPQDYTMSCIIDARKQGFDCDKGEAFESLCRQLDVTIG